MTELIADHLSVTINGATLVHDMSFTLKRGELVALLGPNGAGKSVALRAVLGLAKRAGGAATLGGADTAVIDPMTRARELSYLPQTRPLAWPNTVRDIVALGRFSFGANLGRLQSADADAVASAMAACDITNLSSRKADTLSGGELARVHCARAFAANTPLLVADEPVSALDPRHQYRVMDLIADYVKKGGGALVVLHDIGLAARYAHRLIWMGGGRIIAEGPPAETLTETRLASLYGVKARINGLQVEIEGAL